MTAAVPSAPELGSVVVCEALGVPARRCTGGGIRRHAFSQSIARLQKATASANSPSETKVL